jgi:hypothetical protein
MNSRDVSTRHGASSAPASRPSEALEWLFSRDARYFSGTGTSLAGPASSRREVVPSPLAQSFRASPGTLLARPRAMAVVAAAISAERLASAGERVARLTGAVFVGAGVVLIARAAGL